jgi:hypothetical protein
MIRHQAGKVTRPIEDSVSIIRGLSSAQSITPLPEQVPGNSLRIQRRRLPGSLNAAMIRGVPVLFQKTGFAGSDTGITVGLDPGGTPGGYFAPC